MADKQFAKGIFARKPHEKAPDFVKMELSFKLPDAVQFLESHPDYEGWVKVTIKEGKSGKYYAELNTWTKDAPKAEKAQDDDMGIPF